MGLGNLCFLRSASRLACSVRSISIRRPSLVHKPYCPVRPFVSYSTAANDDDWISSEKAVVREIDAEYNAPAMEINNGNDVLESFIMCMWKDSSKGRMTPPASFSFKIEDILRSRTLTLTREYNGEHIKVGVTMSLPDDSNDDDDDDDAPSNDEDDSPSKESNDDDAPSNESNGDDDDDDERNPYAIPLVVTVTKKSGRSLELRCSCRDFSGDISRDDIHVYLPPGNSSEGPKVIQDMDDFVGMYDHTDLKEAFNKYLKVRGFDESTISFIHSYMLDKMKLEYCLWLDSVKEFLEE